MERRIPTLQARSGSPATDRSRACSAAGLDVETVEDVPLTWRASALDEWWEISSDMSRMVSLLRERLSAEELAGRTGGCGAPPRALRPGGRLAGGPEPRAGRAGERVESGEGRT